MIRELDLLFTSYCHYNCCNYLPQSPTLLIPFLCLFSHGIPLLFVFLCEFQLPEISLHHFCSYFLWPFFFQMVSCHFFISHHAYTVYDYACVAINVPVLIWHYYPLRQFHRTIFLLVCSSFYAHTESMHA